MEEWCGETCKEMGKEAMMNEQESSLRQFWSKSGKDETRPDERASMEVRAIDFGPKEKVQ